jgi:hypothetical protein
MSTPTLHGHLVTPPRSSGKVTKGAKGSIEIKKDTIKGRNQSLLSAKPVTKATKIEKKKEGEEGGEKDIEEVTYVQSELHRHVHFPSKEVPSEALMKVAKLIRDKCIIPEDILIDKVKYGPLAGISYEMRLLANYRSGKLEYRSTSSSAVRRSSRILNSAVPTPLCSECASEEHWRDRCKLL